MRRILSVTAGLTLLATPLLAQSVPPAAGESRSAAVAPTIVAPPVVAAAAATQSPLKSRIGRMFTGAVVGGWLGFFASQVAVSDWDEATNRADEQARGTWAAAGMVVGAVAGRLLKQGEGPPDMPGDMARGRMMLSRDDIVKAGATDAFELVRSLRAEWLIPRGVNSWRESARGSAAFGQPTVIIPGEDHILVYLDNARLGGTQHLESVSLSNVDRIEFIDPAAATFRWGSGHAHGVILITTLPDPERDR